MQEDFSSNEALNRSISILLKIYETEHNQCMIRVGYFFNIYNIYAIIIAAIFSYTLSTRIWDALLILPPIALGLFLRLLWDQHMAAISAAYLRDEIEPILSRFVNQLPEEKLRGKAWTGWLAHYPSKYDALPQNYKHSLFVVFGIVPFGPAIIYSAYCAATKFYPHIPRISVATHLHF